MQRKFLKRSFRFGPYKSNFCRHSWLDLYQQLICLGRQHCYYSKRFGRFTVIFSVFLPINISFQRNASAQNIKHFGLFLFTNYFKMLEIIALPTATKAFREKKL